jgi:hypothetical protein
MDKYKATDFVILIMLVIITAWLGYIAGQLSRIIDLLAM